MAKLIDTMSEDDIIAETFSLTGAYCGPGLIKDALERCVNVLNGFTNLDDEQKEEMIVRMEHIVDDPDFGNKLRVLMGYPERPLSDYRPGMEEAYAWNYYV